MFSMYKTNYYKFFLNLYIFQNGVYKETERTETEKIAHCLQEMKSDD